MALDLLSLRTGPVGIVHSLSVSSSSAYGGYVERGEYYSVRGTSWSLVAIPNPHFHSNVDKDIGVIPCSYLIFPRSSLAVSKAMREDSESVAPRGNMLAEKIVCC